MTFSSIETPYANYAPNFDLRAVVDGDQVLLGVVRCRDLKDDQTLASPWLAFQGVPNTGRGDAGLGEFPTMDAAAAAVAEAAA